MRKLVFATNNAHKLEEVRAVLENKIEIISLNVMRGHGMPSRFI
jgi:XTP/dITP diphosphohydrolase